MKTNRRKFITILSIMSMGTFISINEQAEAKMRINRFGNYKKTNLDDINTVGIKIDEFIVQPNNIEYDKTATIEIEASIEDNDIGQVKSINNIQLDSSGTDITESNGGAIMIKLNEPQLLSYDNYNDNKNYLNIDLLFKLDHPSLSNKVTETLTYKLNIGAEGRLIDNNFDNNWEADIDNNPNSISISGSKLAVLEQNGLEQLKNLINGTTIENKSNTQIQNGVIDIQGSLFDDENVRNYQSVTYDKNSNAEIIEGSDSVSGTDCLS